MKRISFMTLCLILIALVSSAQSGQVKGQLTDSSASHPLADATVALLNGKDSSLAATAFTDKKGGFSFTGLSAGGYRVYITYLGYKPIFKSITVSAAQPVVDMGTIHLQGKGITLGEVEIIQEVPPVVVKKDTLEFNADAFKTRENAVVEDLLKKLPGVTVDKDGTVTAQGETVKRILVDGKPFFGDDPKLATKNLPAEVIDKIQVIDRKSDQAQFTGIDDGNTEKAINITIKKDKKKGVFGKASAGYGTDDRFAVNANANAFRDNRQLSFLGSGNNVNNMGFTMQDVFNFSSSNNGSGGSNGRSGGGGRGAAQSTISNLGGNNSTGITTNWNAGFNYNQDFGSKLKVNGSYFINDVKTETKNQNARQTFTKDSTYYYNSTTGSLTENKNNRLNMRIEYQIDSFHSVILTPTFTYTDGSTNSTSYYQQQDNNKVTSIDGSNMNRSGASSPNFAGSALYRQKFHKAGRTLSANLTYGYNTTDRQNYYNTLDNYVATDTSSAYSSGYNRKTNANNLGRNYQAALTYTEPLMKDRYLELNYTYSNNYSSSTNLTYDANASGKYDILNDSLSNIFENTFSTNQAGINIRTNKFKYDYTFGMNVKWNSLVNDNVSRNTHITQNTVNYFPSASFNYNFEQGRRFRFRYNGSTTQPTISQLQPLPDLSSSLYVQQGNPNLKPTFTHTLMAGYNAFNRSSFRGIFVNANATFANNQIVNANRTDDSTGKQYTKPINTNGVYSLSGSMVNSIPIKNHITSLNVSTNVSYKRDASFTGEDKDFRDITKYYTRNFSLTEGVTFNYFYKELFDVSTSGSVQYAAARYDILPSNNTNYFNYSFSLDFNINLPAGFQLGSDMTYTLNAGRAAGYNVNYTLLNGYVSKFVGKKKQGQFKFYAYDLLKQNVSISRTTGENYIQDTQNMVLQRYFMVSFTYFLRKFGSNNNNNREGPPREMRFMRPPGGGMPGGPPPGGASM
ncbi:outer membrane beta-barrel family protein [Chitinophaga sp.]|uniref:outer membrane beta-barrel family protein n=1 Tax=Chitinophaga sp. TaxID=1869181 RepID=UPI0031D5968B